jgi:hypothetical protein
MSETRARRPSIRPPYQLGPMPTGRLMETTDEQIVRAAVRPIFDLARRGGRMAGPSPPLPLRPRGGDRHGRRRPRRDVGKPARSDRSAGPHGGSPRWRSITPLRRSDFGMSRVLPAAWKVEWSFTPACSGDARSHLARVERAGLATHREFFRQECDRACIHSRNRVANARRTGSRCGASGAPSVVSLDAERSPPNALVSYAPSSSRRYGNWCDHPNRYYGALPCGTACAPNARRSDR